MDVNEKDRDGKTALHYAAVNNVENAAELLISYGADFSIKDIVGKTPLHYAIEHDSEETANLLLSHGAKIL